MSPLRTDSSESRLTNGSTFKGRVIANNFDNSTSSQVTPDTSISSNTSSDTNANTSSNTQGSHTQGSNNSSNTHSSNAYSFDADPDALEIIASETETSSRTDLSALYDESRDVITQLRNSPTRKKRPRNPPPLHIRFAPIVTVDRAESRSEASSAPSTPTCSQPPSPTTSFSDHGHSAPSDLNGPRSPKPRHSTSANAATSPISDTFETMFILPVEPLTPPARSPTRVSVVKMPPKITYVGVPPEPPARATPSLSLLLHIPGLRNFLLLGLPAVICSIIKGLIPVAVSYILQNAINGFTSFDRSASPQPDDGVKNPLVDSITTVVWQFCSLAVLTLFISSVAGWAWTRLGERAASRARIQCYKNVEAKDIAWFDNGMIIDPKSSKNDKEANGAAAFATIFSRSSEDIRRAFSSVLPNLISTITTALAACIIAFTHSWQLTFAILAAMPIVALVSFLCERLSGSLLQAERDSLAEAGRVSEQAISSIAVIKAFNGQILERNRFAAVLLKSSKAWNRTSLIWSARAGFSSSIMLSMLLVGFVVGADLVRKGQLSPGAVFSVIYACVLVTSSSETVLRSLFNLNKGKVAAGIMEDIRTSALFKWTGNSKQLAAITGQVKRPEQVHLRSKHVPTIPIQSLDQIPGKSYIQQMGKDKNESFDRYSDPSSPEQRGIQNRPRSNSAPGEMRKLWPQLDGNQVEAKLQNAFYSYPNRPDSKVLHDITMFFPSGETTFIVGPSGCGKSTVAKLIRGECVPDSGKVLIAGNEMNFLDKNWCYANIGLVEQLPVVFDGSIHQNVCIGNSATARLNGQLDADNGFPLISRADVEAACKKALLHDFVIGLPDGYDTVLGAQGLQLSGGQKQRLSLARAMLGNPPLLILDESTSALDKTSASLVHAATRQWRQGLTTIIITHDLAQVEPNDWVYVMENGTVKEHVQGHQIMSSRDQSNQGPRASVATISRSIPAMWSAVASERPPTTPTTPRTLPALLTDASSDLSPTSPTGLEAQADLSLSGMLPNSPTQDAFNPFSAGLRAVNGSTMRPFSLAATSARIGFSGNQRNTLPLFWQPTEAGRVYNASAANEMALEAEWLHRTGQTAALGRRGTGRTRTQVDEKSTAEVVMDEDQVEKPTSSFIAVSIRAWKRQPNKVHVGLALLVCALSGAIVPTFSYFLAMLLSTMTTKDAHVNVVHDVVPVLILAILEGVFVFLRQFLMEYLAEVWVRTMREDAYERILKQDMRWFDLPENQAAKLAHILVRDAEDARELIGTIWGQISAMMTMVLGSFFWSLTIGWQLTLVGLGFVLLFGGVIHAHSHTVARNEAEHKTNRDDVTKRFFDMAANIRSIRFMALDHIFGRRFYKANDKARNSCKLAGLVNGAGTGGAEGLVYLAEAALFGVGGLLILKNDYTFKQMISVFTSMVFSVTYASQMLSNLPGLAKASQAAASLERLVDLSFDTEESLGYTTLMNLDGSIVFDRVNFQYPGASSLTLRDVSFEIEAGETVAIVGASGSGKSSILNLLQRLYLPDSGTIKLSGIPTQCLDTWLLREHMSVVPQMPKLFDMTVAENIAYGANGFPVPDYQLSEREVKERDQRIQAAAHWANMGYSIRSLPEKYETRLGENGSQLSGGQMQRLAIARALMRRRATVLVLDEFTSALDAENQRDLMDLLLLRNQADPAQSYRHEGLQLQDMLYGQVQDMLYGQVRDMLYGVDATERAARDSVTKWFQKEKVTVLVATHNMEVMKRCSRILVVSDGRVVQDGAYEDLLHSPGPFATLARAGEWGHDN